MARRNTEGKIVPGFTVVPYLLISSTWREQAFKTDTSNRLPHVAGERLPQG
jgi:hypothetical protein